MLTRRQFSLAATTVIAAAVVRPIRAADTVVKDTSPSSQRERYTALVGESFSVYGGSGLVVVTRMTLTGVEDAGSNETVEQFTVMFEAEPGSRSLDVGTYTVEHDTLGRQQLMLEPVATQSGVYTALFNLLR